MNRNIWWVVFPLTISLIGFLIFFTQNEYARAVPNQSLSICRIQGRGSSSRYSGEMLKTSGIVFADLDNTWKRGFFMQDENCDDRSDTSDGIYVYLGNSVDVVRVGDHVEVTGIVNEYYGLTEIVASPENIDVLSSGNPLPLANDLDPPFENEAADVYLEALEGMYVRLDQSVVVGPTNSGDQTWLVRADLGINRVFQDDPLGTGEIICVDDGGSFEIEPEVKVSDLVQDILGAVDYTFGDYCIQLSAKPFVYPINPPSVSANKNSDEVSWSFNFGVSTFNLANLFDTYDDADTEDIVISTVEYQRRLHKHAMVIHDVLGEPTILAVQEVENLDILQALLDQPEIETEYGITWMDTPDRRGLDSALLYRTDSVQIGDYRTVQGCTSLKDGLGPDGNLDVFYPQNMLTCDTDGNGVFDGNRLFSRPPLLVQLRVCKSICSGNESTFNTNPEDLDLYILVNHWKSKSQDSDSTEYTLPRRLEQAHFVIALMDELWATDPESEFILLGDFNDYLTSQPLSVLSEAGFVDLLPQVQKNNRYTYIYKGVSQVLDHVFIRAQGISPIFIFSDHINSDYPHELMSEVDSIQRSSDHDPVRVIFHVSVQSIYFPMITH